MFQIKWECEEVVDSFITCFISVIFVFANNSFIIIFSCQDFKTGGSFLNGTTFLLLCYYREAYFQFPKIMWVFFLNFACFEARSELELVQNMMKMQNLFISDFIHSSFLQDILSTENQWRRAENTSNKVIYLILPLQQPVLAALSLFQSQLGTCCSTLHYALENVFSLTDGRTHLFGPCPVDFLSV